MKIVTKRDKNGTFKISYVVDGVKRVILEKDDFDRLIVWLEK